jgi:hypothetical protein
MHISQMTIHTVLEEWSGSAVIRDVNQRNYKRIAASDYKDEAAGLTSRQVVFYRNIINIALELKSETIPVDFKKQDGTSVYLDRGCIKIAEHAEFILPLSNDVNGVVSSIKLSWKVSLT